MIITMTSWRIYLKLEESESVYDKSRIAQGGRSSNTEIVYIIICDLKYIIS